MRSIPSAIPALRLVVAALGAVIGAILLIALLRSSNLDQVGSDFSHVEIGYLLLAFPPFLVNLLAKVPRWRLLFADKKPGWDALFGGMNVGYAINALLPLRLGELVRAYWMRDRAGIPMMQTLSTIALERVIDGVTLLVLLAFTAPTVAFPRKLLASAVGVGVIFIVVLVVMVVLAHGSTDVPHQRLARFVSRLEDGKFGVVGRGLREALLGLRSLRNKRAVALVAFYTLLIWASNSLLIWLVVRAFHISIPLAGGVLLTAVLNLGMAVPSSPGYLGVFDYLMVLTLRLYGVAHTPAVAAALAFHAVAFVPVTIVGVAYLGRLGVQATLQMVRSSASS